MFKEIFFWLGPRGAGIRRLTSRQEIQGNPYYKFSFELELELIQTQMTQKPMLRAEVRMRVRCANKASAE